MSDITDAKTRSQAMNDALAEIARLRLTDAERAALVFFGGMRWPKQPQQVMARAATLRGLLERMGGER